MAAERGPMFENGRLEIMAVWRFKTAVLIATERGLNHRQLSIQLPIKVSNQLLK